jgi:3-hydroxyisobutyrate dehydrogenase-like beta-hydroxyacid dehydrogenase
MRVAVLGLGLMGEPMARQLLAHGHEVQVWNRTAERARQLVQEGAAVAQTPGGAVTGAEIVILVLLNGEVVSDVLFNSDLADHLEPGQLIIDMSTISPTAAVEHARRLSTLGHESLDAPVSGGTRGAASGKLTIMVGGDAAAFARAEPMLSAMGHAHHVGPAGTGQVAKAANQLIVAVSIGAVAEALTLVSRSGADAAAVRQALLGGFADSRILREHGERMVQRAFTPGAVARGQLKDLRIIGQLMEDQHLDLPLCHRVTELFESLAASEHGELDHSALLLEIERLNVSRNGGTPA